MVELRGSVDFRVQSALSSAKAMARERAGKEVGTHVLLLHNAPLLGDIGLKALGESCPMLTQLDVSGAFRISDVGVYDLFPC